MAAMQIQKSLIKTKTAIDQVQSLELVQTMLHSGVADVSSDFFTDGAFEEMYYDTSKKGYSYEDYTSGNTATRRGATKIHNHTKIQVLRRGRTRRVDIFLDWLVGKLMSQLFHADRLQEKGVFVALKAGNLDAVQVHVHPDEKTRSKVLEQYTFKILYTTTEQHQRTPSSLRLDSPGKYVHGHDKVSLTSSNRTGIAKRYISLKLCYREGTGNRKLVGFVPAAANDVLFAHARGWKQQIDSLTKFKTLYHSLQPLQNLGASRRNAKFPKSIEYVLRDNIDIAALRLPSPEVVGTPNMSDMPTESTLIEEVIGAVHLEREGRMASLTGHARDGLESRSPVTVVPTKENVLEARDNVFHHKDATQPMCDKDALEMGVALENMMRPEHVTQGDTQSQGLRPHRSPTAFSTTTISPSLATNSPSKSTAGPMSLISRPALLQQKRKALNHIKDRRRKEGPKRGPSRIKDLQKSKAADIVNCACGHIAEEGDMHLHCYGYTGSHDPRLPDEHACYKCLLGEEEAILSRRLTDLSLVRRGIHFAQEHGLTTQQQFGKDMGPIFVAYGRSGYVVEDKTARKGSNTAKRHLVVVKSGPGHKKMLDDLFNPMLHIAHHVSWPIVRFKIKQLTPVQYEQAASPTTLGTSTKHISDAAHNPAMPPPTTPASTFRGRREKTVTSASGLDRSVSRTPFKTPSRSYSRVTRSQKRAWGQGESPEMPAKRQMRIASPAMYYGSVQSEMVLDASGMPSSPAVI
nr:meiosis-specific protein hop1 [Quercus suber]